MILLVSTCSEKLSELEFVKPIEKILKEMKLASFTKHYLEINKPNLEKADKIIICGTALNDFDYVNNLNDFFWIKDCEKPIFGICSGMQIIGMFFGSKPKRKKEIGIGKINLRKEFLGMKENFEGYFLHNLSVTKANFEILADSGTDISAIKHKTKPIYGVLFHPEVRNNILIEEFAKL